MSFWLSVLNIPVHTFLLFLPSFTTLWCVCVCVGSAVSAQPLSSVQLFVTPQTVAPQAPLSVGFPRHEHWSGKPKCKEIGLDS